MTESEQLRDVVVISGETTTTIPRPLMPNMEVRLKSMVAAYDLGECDGLCLDYDPASCIASKHWPRDDYSYPTGTERAWVLNGQGFVRAGQVFWAVTRQDCVFQPRVTAEPQVDAHPEFRGMPSLNQIVGRICKVFHGPAKS